MNHNLHLPRIRPARQNPQWLIDAARWIGRQRRHLQQLRNRLRHYRDYRSLGQGAAESWDKAGRTL